MMWVLLIAMAVLVGFAFVKWLDEGARAAHWHDQYRTQEAYATYWQWRAEYERKRYDDLVEKYRKVNRPWQEEK